LLQTFGLALQALILLTVVPFSIEKLRAAMYKQRVTTFCVEVDQLTQSSQTAKSDLNFCSPGEHPEWLIFKKSRYFISSTQKQVTENLALSMHILYLECDTAASAFSTYLKC